MKVQRSERRMGAACVSQPQELLTGVFEIKLTPRPISLVTELTEGGLVEWARESDGSVAVFDARFVSRAIWM